jgi:predicted MFS family arabinose efflux permease
MSRPQSSAGRVLAVVGLVMFVEAMLFSALAPLLPRYADELGFGTFEAGVLTGCFALGVFVGSLASGAAASRHGGKPVLAAGAATMITASILFGLARNVAVLDVARLIQGLGGGMVWAGGLTWIAACAPPEGRATAIGTAIGVGICGALLGPPLGGLAVVTSTQLVFSILVPIGLLLPLTLVARTPGSAAVHVDGSLRDLFERPYRRRAVGAAWVMLLPAVGLGLLNVLGPLRLDAAGAAVGGLTLVYVLAGAAEGGASPLAGRLADRRDPNAIVRWILLLLTVEFAVFAAADGAVALAVLVVLLGGTFGLMWAPANARTHLVAESASVGDAHVFAIFNICFAGGQILGGTGGGALAELAGEAVPSLLLAGAALGTSLAMLSTRRGAGAHV